MNIQLSLFQIAQQAASDLNLLAAIRAAHTEVGRNNLERSLHLQLASCGLETSNRSDIVSDFFTVFG